MMVMVRRKKYCSKHTTFEFEEWAKKETTFDLPYKTSYEIAAWVRGEELGKGAKCQHCIYRQITRKKLGL